MFLILVLCAQLTMDNAEAKYFCPRPGLQYERAESTHSFNALKYDLDVNLPMTERSLAGLNTIACRSRVDGLATATLHSYTLTIDSVKVDGATASFATADETLHIDLPQTYNNGDSFNIEIGYHGLWDTLGSQYGFIYYKKRGTSRKHTIAYTMSEPWDARRWMPCYDEPYDKADYGCVISVTVPDTFVVCANGELISEIDNLDNTKTFIWEELYSITTYLMHFCATRYAIWSDWYYEQSGDSIEIRHFVWPEDSAVSDTAFQHVPTAMALFDSMYGSYPFDRYGQDAVYPFAWGGMEHQEISTIHRGWVTGKYENGMAHELAHQWWGDMVTCVDFRDIWLNEGFATYSDANYNWYRFGYENFQNTMQSRANSYFSADASSRRPLYDPPLIEMFNWGYTYCKASWVVHMLRYLDEDNFFPAVHAYRDSFEYGTADTEDINNVFSDVYGTDLTWFFDEWVYDQGYPEYEVYWVCNPAETDYLAILEIHQVQTDAPQVFHMPVNVLLHMTRNDTVVTIQIDGSPEHVEYSVSDSVTSIEFDPDNWILKKYEIHLIDTIGPSAPYIAQVEKADTNAILTWNEVTTDTLGAPETMDCYVVYRNTSPSFIPLSSDSIGVVLHPDTTYIDTGALEAESSYYYIVKAVDAERNMSRKSNMAYVFSKIVNENIAATNKNWTSLPYHTEYDTVSDVTDDLSPNGDPLRKITNLRDDQLYESWTYTTTPFPRWTGTNFTIVSGDAYEMVTIKDTTVILVGCNEPDSSISLNENADATDKNWVSVPYNVVYDSVEDITNEYSPSGNPLTKITNFRDDQLYESWTYTTTPFPRWTGANFTIEAGRGYEFMTISDTTWNPTEYDNEQTSAFLTLRVLSQSDITMHVGTLTEPDRGPLLETDKGGYVPAGIRYREAGVSHLVRGYFELTGCDNIVFTVCRPDRPYDLLTENMVGSGFATDDKFGLFWFDVGNFKKPWQDDEEVILTIEVCQNGVEYSKFVNFTLDKNCDIQELGNLSLFPAVRGSQDESAMQVPKAYAFDISPNPFVKQTRIDYALPTQVAVGMVIYDVSGRVVKTVASETHEPGYYSTVWDGTDERGRQVSSGIYFVRFEAATFRIQDKLLLVK